MKLKNYLLFFLITILFAGCGKKKEEVIKIGAILPLTGSAAQWGIPPKNGALLALEEINKNGGIDGKKIELKIRDDKCEPRDAVSAVQNMLTQFKPLLILGAVCSSSSLAIAPILERNKIVMISPASTSPLLTDAGDYIFRVVPTDALRGKIFAEYIYSLGHRRISLLYINNEGGVGNQKTFAENFKKLGGKIVSTESYPQDARDMRSQLTNIKKIKPDALVIVSYPDDTPLVLRQSKELKVDVPLFFQTEALDDPAVLQKAGDAAEGVTYILPEKPSGEVVDKFASEYKAKYGNEPELYAAEGYDIVILISKVLKTNPNMSSTELKDKLYKIKDYRGASGIITFDQNGDVLKPMAINKIKNGKKEILRIYK